MNKLTKLSSDWSLEEKSAFLYGYTYAQAERAKKSGAFEDLSINEIIKIIFKEISK